MAVALCFLGSSSGVVPRRAEAGFVGLLIAYGGSSLAGGVGLLAAAGSTGGAILFAQRAWDSRGSRAVAYTLLAVGCAIGAFYLLDSPEKASGELRSLSPPEAARIGMTPEEHRAYESSLPEINAVREEAIVRVAREFPEGSVNNRGQFEKVLLRLHEEWRALAPAVLDARAVAAIDKLSESARRSLQ